MLEYFLTDFFLSYLLSGWVTSGSKPSEFPDGLNKFRLLGPSPSILASVGLRQSLETFISNMFPGYADAEVLGTIL